jgi:hypothetical protein
MHVYIVMSIEAPEMFTRSSARSLRRDISSPIVRSLESVARERESFGAIVY